MMLQQTYIRSAAFADADDTVRVPGGLLGRLILRTSAMALVEVGVAGFKWFATADVPPSKRERLGRRLEQQAAQRAAFVAEAAGAPA